MLLLSKISGSAIKNFSSPAFMQEVPYFSLISRQSVLLSELQSAVEPRKALFSRCRHTHCSVMVMLMKMVVIIKVKMVMVMLVKMVVMVPPHPLCYAHASGFFLSKQRNDKFKF